MGRIIIYGDIHGCLDEWMLLRKELRITPEDAEISVGDLLSKGPKPLATLRYARQHGITTVLGNHEERFLEIAHAHQERPGVTLHRASQKIYQKLDSADLAYLFAMPRFVRIANLTIVHAGLTNAINLQNIQPEEEGLLTRLRYISRGAGTYEYVFWAEVYNGNQGFVVYGHTPQDLTRHPNALGIDTGCVYGEQLTAAVFEHKAARIDTKNYQIVQVAAKERYA